MHHHARGSVEIRIVLGMGCFWGAEKRMSELPGVVDVESGYANAKARATTRPSSRTKMPCKPA
jgi:peptide methionine sulfoxide reductase MsrA